MIPHKDTQRRYNLPNEVRYCVKCTMSNQRPRITFDAQGVCSACNFAVYKHSQINWEEREKELLAMLDRHRSSDGSYDVIVPSSGGKDSALVAHQLKYKYGMNPLTVTWSPHLYTDIGWQNFQAMIHVGGLDNVLATPNGVVHRKLTKLAFDILGDPFQPFIYGQYNFPLKMALQHRVKLVMYGENGEVEYGGDMKNAYKPTRDYKGDQNKHYFSSLPPEDLVKYGVKQAELVPYMRPSDAELDALGVEIHFFSYYHKWLPQENFYYATEHTGFQPNPDRNEGTYSKYASLDDKLDGYHYYLSYIKFGIGRATSDSAHEVRDGHITREEGVALVSKFDGEFPKKHYETFLKYCDITDEQFWEVIDSWRSPHIWKKEENVWHLRHRIDGTGVDD